MLRELSTAILGANSVLVEPGWQTVIFQLDTGNYFKFIHILEHLYFALLLHILWL